MHIIYQIPLVDMRSLDPTASSHTLRSWATGNPNSKPFVRGFGLMKQRYRGGIDELSGEEIFCDASACIKYADLHKQGYKVNANATSIIQKSYRRLYSVGPFTNKLELSFVDNLEQTITKISSNKTKVNITLLLKHYLSIQGTIDGKKKKLYNSALSLSKKYCDATTPKGRESNTQRKFVSAGLPCLMIVFKTNKSINIPDAAKLVKEFVVQGERVKLYGYKFHQSGYYFKTWLIEISENEPNLPLSLRQTLRQLRINLLHIHAEKETLRILLNEITLGRFNPDTSGKEGQQLQAYFKNASEKLFKKSRYGIDQQNILNIALQSEDTISPGQYYTLDALINSFEDRHARKNAEKFIEKVAAADKKVILFITSNPTDKTPLNFNEEFDGIKKALNKSVDRGNYHIELEPAVSKDDLFDLIDQYKPSFLHITLHASPEKGLYFRNAHGDPLPMDAKEFQDVIQLASKKSTFEVIVLSACNSEAHAKVSTSYSNYSIGTQAVFPDEASIAYAKGFYQRLFNANSSDIPFCHDAGLLKIRQYIPAIAPVIIANGSSIEACNIPILFSAKSKS